MSISAEHFTGQLKEILKDAVNGQINGKNQKPKPSNSNKRQHSKIYMHLSDDIGGNE